jgi:glucose/arabinose dehydrogenase
MLRGESVTCRLYTRRPRLLWWLLVLSLVWTPPAAAQSAAPNRPPEMPVIASPAPFNVAPDDVHMEMGAPFVDPDGDEHRATDWEIRARDGQTTVWTAYNSDVLTHAHLADGRFEGPLAGRRGLEPKAVYFFRVRYQDSRGAWSAWAERQFITLRLDRAIPRQARGFLPRPAPTWLTEGGGPVGLAAGARVELRSLAGVSLLRLAGDGDGVAATTEPILSEIAVIRLHVAAGETALQLPPSRLSVVTDHAERLTIFLPALALAPGREQILWLADTGATFYHEAGRDALPFDRLARDVPIPWQVEPGYEVEAVSAALQLPTSLAFVPNPSPDPGAARFYVTELHGRIKVVTNDGRVLNFAEGLLNFDPSGDFPGSGEVGVIGVCLQPGSRDVYATLVHEADRYLRIRIVRIRTEDGLTATGVETVLAGRSDQGYVRYSHQIQQCSFGPDGKLYTFVADGTGPRQAADDGTFNGKVLRLNPDGSAPPDNPRYDPANPTAPISYQYTKGQRNAFGMAWRPSDGRLYLTENGPNVDRLVRVTPGLNYGWDGSDQSMTTNALYVWPEAHWSPVGLTFAEGPAAAGLPADKQGHLFVASAGTVYAEGPQRTGKAIQEFVLEPDGAIRREPTVFARYTGAGRGSIVDLKLQPDGLYFTDLYHEDDDHGPTAPGGRVWRIHHRGQAAFTTSTATGPAPLTVAFTNTSSPGAARWEFGDGATSEAANPQHTFTVPGRYAISLTLTLPDGARREALTLVTVTEPGGGLSAGAAATVRLDTPASSAVLAFPRTGVVLGGGFKHFWERHGGAARFGDPITAEFRERNPDDGREYTVQYFERARFEYHPEHRGTDHETQLGLLGRQLTAGRLGEAPFARVDPASAAAGARYFEETGHTVGGVFLSHWETTGGLAVYGLPLSEPFMEAARGWDAVLVQYFERARFEHRPAYAGTAAEVALSRLGSAVYIARPSPRLS